MEHGKRKLPVKRCQCDIQFTEKDRAGQQKSHLHKNSFRHRLQVCFRGMTTALTVSSTTRRYPPLTKNYPVDDFLLGGGSTSRDNSLLRCYPLLIFKEAIHFSIASTNTNCCRKTAIPVSGISGIFSFSCIFSSK